MQPEVACHPHFWIEVAGVIATLILAAVAIWGDPIRARLVGPRLRLRLLDARGERQQIATGDFARFYHLEVTNERRFAPAKNVRVVLTGIARPDANGQFQWSWLSGPIQLLWQHGHSLPQFLTLGPPQNADLGNVTQHGGIFSLALLFVPIGRSVSLAGPPAPNRMIIEARAKSDEAESPPVRVQIAWNGKWSDDAAEMANNLVMAEVPHVARD